MKTRLGFVSRFLLKVTVLAVCLLLVSATAVAYTLVMRSGRLVEVPATFVLRDGLLTYEVGPGLQGTIQVRAIDIVATEKANREPAGSFLKHAQMAAAPQASTLSQKPTAPTRSTTLSVTNKDLESIARVRRDSETAYEVRRQQLGLPSAEQSRETQRAEIERMRIQSAQQRSEDAANAAYWHQRATALRDQLDGVDAEIRFLRERLSLPLNSIQSIAVAPALLPFIGFSSSVVSPSFRSNNFGTNTLLTSRGGSQFGIQPGFNRPFIHGGGFNRFRPNVGQAFGGIFPTSNIVGYSWPYGAYDSYYERTELVLRLDGLLSQRATLEVQWRQLEDDARRAGALPGWLRR